MIDFLDPARRSILRGLIAMALGISFLHFATHCAFAREINDANGRTVTIPDAPARVFAAGPPASTLLYVLKPEAMIGWVRAPRESDLAYLLPSTRALPELGRLTGRGDTLNLEVLLANTPDLIVDYGTVNDTYKTLADRVQEQAGIPYVLIDGSFANTPAAIRQMADILDVPERGEELATYAEETLAMVDAVLATVPAEARPGVYLARGPEGLESAATGSINAEIIERAGGRNVAVADSEGLVTASPELVLTWAPDVIVTIDRDFASTVGTMPEWASVPAVAGGRIYLAPSAPFGFIDSPPSVNRLMGLHWLMHQLYPDQAQGDLTAEVQKFYKLFYQVELDAGQVAKLLGQ